MHSNHEFIITNSKQVSHEMFQYTFKMNGKSYLYTFLESRGVKLDEQLWLLKSNSKSKIANQTLLNNLHLAVETAKQKKISFPCKFTIENEKNS